MAMIPKAPAQPIKQLKAKLGTVTDPAQQARINTRIGFLQKQNGGPRIPKATPAAGTPDPGTFTGLGRTGYGKGLHGSHKFNGPAPTPNTIQPVTTPQAPPAAVTPPAATPPSQDQLETLFPSTRMFEPQNYEGSPLYQFQVKEGLDQVSKSLAARGLTNSGAGIRAELNVPMMAAAQDTDRMTRIASENANRLESFQNNEALRQERAGNNQWDRMYSLAQLMAQQSPWDAAVGGLDSSATIMNAQGQSQANFLKDYYQRIIAAGGGGGGGGQPGVMPTGPDYSNIIPAQINANYDSSKGWGNIFTQALAGLFPAAPAQVPATNTTPVMY